MVVPKRQHRKRIICCVRIRETAYGAVLLDIVELTGRGSDGRRSTFSARELRRDMETFCETGVHPDIQKAVREHEESSAEEPLPAFNPRRPFVFLSLYIAAQTSGRLVIELFNEHNARGVEILQNRCRVGSRLSLKDTSAHKLLTDCAIFFGKPRATSEVIRCPRLHHTDCGAVSVSTDGNEVLITLKEDALALDETHEVVGRVHSGFDVLEKINEIIPGPVDVPLDEIRITQCGQTDCNGNMDVETSVNTIINVPSQDIAVQQLRQDTQRVQMQLRSALDEGLGLKRRQEQKTESEKTAKKRLLDHDLSSDSSSDNDES